MGPFKCITGLLSQNPLAVNKLTSPKSPEICKKVLLSSFFSFSAKLSSKKLFSTRSEILLLLDNTRTGNHQYSLVVERICRYKFKRKYLKNYQPFLLFFLKFWNVLDISNVLKKKIKPYRSSFSEVIDSEVRAYLNA